MYTTEPHFDVGKLSGTVLTKRFDIISSQFPDYHFWFPFWWCYDAHEVIESNAGNYVPISSLTRHIIGIIKGIKKKLFTINVVNYTTEPFFDMEMEHVDEWMSLPNNRSIWNRKFVVPEGIWTINFLSHAEYPPIWAAGTRHFLSHVFD